MDARVGNERIAEKAEALRFLSRVPMLCECSSDECRTIVMIALPEYREIRRKPELIITAPGHDADRVPLHKETPAYEVRRAVLKDGDGDGERRCG